MATVSSTLATSQALAMVKGPSAGSAGNLAAPVLRILEDKATLGVANPLLDVSEGECVRFGIIPKGARIIRSLTRLVTDHSAAIAGALVLRPLDGSTATTVASVTAQLETVALTGNAQDLEHGTMLDCADAPVATADSWVEFLPTSDLVIASTAKSMWARIAYSTTY